MPKLVNLVTHLTNRLDAASPMLAIDTVLPSTPALYWSCVDPIRMLTNKQRLADKVPHGLAQFVPRIDATFAPDICQGSTSIWLGGPPCKTGQPCNFHFAQAQPTPPTLDWSTPVIPCKVTDQAAYCQLSDASGFRYGSLAVYQEVSFNTVSAQPPLTSVGTEIGFPQGGSFSCVFGCKVTDNPDGCTPVLWVGDNMGNIYKKTDTQGADGRSCAGLAGVLPRTMAPPGVFALTLFTSGFGGPRGNWSFAANGIFQVQWWPN